MNTDFRIEVGFFDHHKTRRLIASLGLPAVWSLMRLWEFATVNKPDGELRGMTPSDIAAACHYEADPDSFLAELERLGWINREYSHGVPVFSLHDWQEHQPFVVNAPARRDAARKAAESRWKKQTKGSDTQKADAAQGAIYNDATRMRPASTDAEGNADRNAGGNAPAFLPSSLPTNQTPLPPVTPSQPPALPSPFRSGFERNRRGGGFIPAGAYREPKGARPTLTPEFAERMETYRAKRSEIEQEIRGKHPTMPDAEVLALLTAELKRQGITA